MLSQEVKDAAAIIGQYYLKKNNGDYSNAALEIENLKISKIEVVGGSEDSGSEDSSSGDSATVVITTQRPGLLIGKRGSNVDGLSQALGKKIKIIEESNTIEYYLIPWRDARGY